MKRIIRKLTMYPRAEHLHKGCIGYDHDEGEYCCCECLCCPCYSWRCGVCLWQHKPIFKKVGDWAWMK